MGEFLLEVYVPRGDRDAADRGALLSRRASEELTGQGAAVRLLRSIYVPDDETCLFLFEAVSVEVVREVARRAELSFERVVATAGSTPGGDPSDMRRRT